MIMQTIKKILGKKVVDKIRPSKDYLSFSAKKMTDALIFRFNSVFGYKYLNIAAGRDVEMFSWWTGDYQTGYIIDEDTILPFANASIEFAFCSMFFEHISDQTALNLLKEVKRVLKPGGYFRIVVPDFNLYIKKYEEKDYNFFYSEENENFKTWERLNVPVDLEHLLVNMVSAIHNLPHEMVSYQYQEDLNRSPARVLYPFQVRLNNYYCGPAPELTTEMIKQKFNELSNKDFLQWVFSETNKSAYQDPTFNSWHKNSWDMDKIRKFAYSAGFSNVTASDFGNSPIKLSKKIEKTNHERLGLYFNLLS